MQDAACPTQSPAGWAKSTTSRLLLALERNGLVRRDDHRPVPARRDVRQLRLAGRGRGRAGRGGPAVPRAARQGDRGDDQPGRHGTPDRLAEMGWRRWASPDEAAEKMSQRAATWPPRAGPRLRGDRRGTRARSSGGPIRRSPARRRSQPGGCAQPGESHRVRPSAQPPRAGEPPGRRPECRSGCSSVRYEILSADSIAPAWRTGCRSRRRSGASRGRVPVAKAPREFDVQARNPAHNVHIGD